MMLKKTSKKKENIEKRLRKIVKERIEEKEASAKSVSHQELYERMVEEAVLLISASWEESAKYRSDLVFTEPLRAKNVFFITKNELKIFAEHGYRVDNYKTGHCCFFDTFTFESMEEVEKYIEDVKSQLPEKTVVECTEDLPWKYEKLGLSLFYSFEVDVM